MMYIITNTFSCIYPWIDRGAYEIRIRTSGDDLGDAEKMPKANDKKQAYLRVSKFFDEDSRGF